MPGRGALDGRLRRRRERRRRPHHGAPSRGCRQGGAHRRCEVRRDGSRRPGGDRRCVVRHGFQRRAARRGCRADRADQRNRAARVFAVDVPSGVDASTGEIAGAAVQADATVTFHGRKVGLVVAPGRFHAGACVVADIGLEPAETRHRLVRPSSCARPAPRRQDNKYTAGHVLVVGGSPGLTGAPSLTARRGDARRRRLRHGRRARVGHARARAAARRGREEAAAGEARRRGGRRRARARAEGVRRRARARARPRERRRRRSCGGCSPRLELPVVVDADALFELEPGDWPGPRVLTPHEGELGAPARRDSKDVAAHRLAAVQEAAERFRCVVAPERRRHARRLAWTRRPRRRARTALARDCRHRRRADRHRRGVPRQGNGAATRGRGGGGARSSALQSRRRSARASSRAISSKRCPRARSLMYRSELDNRPRLRCVATRDASPRARRRGALGRRQGGRVRPRRSRRRRRRARRGSDRALRRNRSGRPRAPARVPRRAHRRHGPATSREIGHARDAQLELVVSSDEIPPGVRVHVKLDTGMGRWGLAELTRAAASKWSA